MRIRRNLLEEVRLTRSARPEFDQVVVALDERHHAQKKCVLRSIVETRRLKPDAAQEHIAPLTGREAASTLGKNIKDLALRQLNRSQGVDAERSTTFFLGDGAVISQSDFRIEAASEHALVLLHHVGG